MIIPMRAFLIIIGISVVVIAGISDSRGSCTHIIIYVLANLAVLVGVLKRCTLRRMIVAVLVLAVTIRVSMVGISSLGHRFHDIKSGMTVEEVRRRMVGFKEGSGLNSPYTGKEFVTEGTLIFRDPNASASHQDWGIVVIRGGRVKEVFFSPD